MPSIIFHTKITVITAVRRYFEPLMKLLDLLRYFRPFDAFRRRRGPLIIEDGDNRLNFFKELQNVTIVDTAILDQWKLPSEESKRSIALKHLSNRHPILPLQKRIPPNEKEATTKYPD